MKKTSFSKKLLSLFLAVVMALSCFTAVMSTYAASSDTESELYEADNSYNYLGWVKTSDEQKLSALLDLVDSALASAGLNQLLEGFAPGGEVNVNELLKGAVNGADISGLVNFENIKVDLSSVNGVLSTIASAEKSLREARITSAASLGDLENINLHGVYKDYYKTGKIGTVMTRENSTSKEIISGLLNVVYMNTNDHAYNANKTNGVGDGIFTGNGKGYNGGPIIQRILNDGNAKDEYGLNIKLAGIAELDILELVKVPSLIGIPAEGAKNWNKNVVNNLLTYFLGKYAIDPLIVSEETEFPNYVDMTSETWKFKDSKDGTKTYSFEEIIAMMINRLVLPTIKNIDSEYVFEDKIEYTTTDPLMAHMLDIIKPLMSKVLVPLFSTISLDFGFIPELNRMYAAYVKETYSTWSPANIGQAKARWNITYINQWINSEYKNIADYLMTIQDWDGNYLCPGIDQNSSADDVKASMVNLFNSLQRDTEEVDLTYLFTNMLYSPIAEALGCKTGMLNLNVRDYYFGCYENFYAQNVKYGDDTMRSVYPVLKELLSALFPTVKDNEWASAPNDLDGLVKALVSTAGTLLTKVADSANTAVLRDFHAKYGENAVLDESNLEDAVAPLMIGAVMHAETFSQVHTETWNKVEDLNGLMFVLLSEYLKSVLPEYDYSGLAERTHEDGKVYYDADLEKVLLPMARDCIAVIAQGIVPLNWDVFKSGGTKVENGVTVLKDNTDIFDLVNKLVCYFADDLGIAPLFGLTEYVVNINGKYNSIGMGHETDKSAMNDKYDLWTNADIFINTLMPSFSTLFTNKGEGTFNSKMFFYDTILNGILNVGADNTTDYGHGKGISSLVYELGYLLFKSAPLTQKAVINVIYNFLREAINTVFASRYPGDPDKGVVIPKNDKNTPITDLVQTKVLFGTGVGRCGPVTEPAVMKEVGDDGILGTLAGRLVDAIGGSQLYISDKAPKDTVTKGAMNLVYIVNALVTFFPNLGQNTLHGANAWLTKSNFDGSANLGDEKVYMAVQNPSAGLKRAIMDEVAKDSTKSTYKQLTDRYFIKVTKIECPGVSGFSADLNPYKIGKNGAYDKAGRNTIRPTETLFFKLSGSSSVVGSKEVKITYDVVDKNGNTYAGDAANYSGLTTYTHINISNGTSFVDELYDKKTGGFLEYIAGVIDFNDKIEYQKESTIAAKSTKLFSNVSIAYPANIAINNSASDDLEKYRFAVSTNNTGKKHLSAVYPYVIVNGVKKAMVSCDANGNLIDYSKPMEYYHPITKEWDENPSIVVGGKTYGNTDSRYHVSYAKDKAALIGGYEAFPEKGYALVNFSEDVLANVSCASPIKGTYIKASNIDLNNAEYFENNFISWLYPITGPNAGIEVPDGVKTIDLAAVCNGKEETFSINVIAQNSGKRSALQNKYNQAMGYVNSHLDSDFVNNDPAVLQSVRNEINTAYALLNEKITRQTTDKRFEEEIKKLNDVIKAANAKVKVEDGKKQDLVNIVARDVANDINQHYAYDYYNINYDLTRNISNLAWSVLGSSYANPELKVEKSTDKEFDRLSSHRVYVQGSNEFVDEVNYNTFLIKLNAGSYDIYGLDSNSVEGTDYFFAKEEPQTDDYGSIIYDYSSSASVVELRELQRLYGLYKQTMITRAYEDNDTAILNEIKCATNTDAANLSFNDGTIAVNNGVTEAHYGAVENGVLVNKGATVYTDDTWKAYVEAVGAAVQATKEAKASVLELDRLRLNVMYAENNLEAAQAVEIIEYTYTFANGNTVKVKAPEGTAPKAPENSEPTYAYTGRGSNKTHKITEYSWPEFKEGTTAYKEESKTTTGIKCSGSVAGEEKEATRGEAGYKHSYCVCDDKHERPFEETIPALGIDITIKNDRNNLGTATITADLNKGVDSKNPNVTNVKYTTEYTLTAKPNENAEFIGWYTGNKLITADETYTTSAYADTVYEPVFAEKQDSNTFTITFMGYYGNIIATVSSENLATFEMPTAPADYIGVKFADWSLSKAEIRQLTESTVVYALYEKTKAEEFTVKADDCIITVDGKEVANNSKVAYDSKVTVRADKGTATEWYINDVLVGYGEEFSFFCSQNSTVTYKTAPVASNAVVSIISDTEDEATRRVRFVASRSIPEEYEVVESGFLYGKGIAAQDLILENANVVSDKLSGLVHVSKVANAANEGQFGLIFGVTGQTAPASARAYVIYKDATGAKYVIYSEAVIHEFK